MYNQSEIDQNYHQNRGAGLPKILKTKVNLMFTDAAWTTTYAQSHIIQIFDDRNSLSKKFHTRFIPTYFLT